MVVGDKKGKVGVGLGKAPDVQSAMKKGAKKAKKRMIVVPIDGTTIPFKFSIKLGAGRVMLKPAPKGSGVIAGGPVRAVVEAAGIRDISSKILGTQNQASNVYATFAALQEISRIVTLKGISLKSIAQVEAEEDAKLLEEQKRLKSVAAKTPTTKAPAAVKEQPKPKSKAAPKVKTTPKTAKITAKKPAAKKK